MPALISEAALSGFNGEHENVQIFWDQDRSMRRAQSQDQTKEANVGLINLCIQLVQCSV